jgi:hypothetical protein
VDRRIRNPLVGIPKETLLQDVDEFAREKGLEDIRELLQRGALAAQHPENTQDIPELTAEEKQAFVDEVEHRWRHPKVTIHILYC